MFILQLRVPYPKSPSRPLVSVNDQCLAVSNEKKGAPGCLRFSGDEILLSFARIIVTHETTSTPW